MGRREETGTPQITEIPYIYLTIEDSDNLGGSVMELQYKNMLNSGYVIYAKMMDVDFEVVTKLILDTDRVTSDDSTDTGKGFFSKVRKKPMKMKIKIGWKTDDDSLETEEVTGYIVGACMGGKAELMGEIEIIAIDPASYLLNEGDASGGYYEGKVSEVIEKVVDKYGKNLSFEITPETNDSKHGIWYQMRQDPKTFIMSLLDWSYGLLKNPTEWLIYPDNMKFKIIQQSKMESKKRSMYKWKSKNRNGDILNWGVVIDSILSSVQHKLVTHGISAISGAYHDKVTDKDEQVVFAKDKTTSSKKIAKSNQDNSTTKRPDDVKAGYTSVPAVPEFSGGDIGIKYKDYINGFAIGEYLKLNRRMFRSKITIPGHHIWDGSEGLGVDTINIEWLDESNMPFFMNGNWVVEGFEHFVIRIGPGISWNTDLFLARSDHDSAAQKVP